MRYEKKIMLSLLLLLVTTTTVIDILYAAPRTINQLTNANASEKQASAEILADHIALNSRESKSNTIHKRQTLPQEKSASDPLARLLYEDGAVSQKTTTQVSAITAKQTGSPVKDSMKGDLFKFKRKANLRAGPDVKFDVVSWASMGSLAYELSRKGNWMRVQMKVSKRIGWAYNESLDWDSVGIPAPKAGEKGVSSTKALVVAKVSPIKVPSHAELRATAKKHTIDRAVRDGVIAKKQSLNKDKQLSSAKQTSSPVKDSMKGDLFKFKRKANLRAGPDVKFDVVSWASMGSLAYELSRKGNWMRVQMKVSKRIGWVYNESLDWNSVGIPAPKSGEKGVPSTKALVVAKVSPIKVPSHAELRATTKKTTIDRVVRDGIVTISPGSIGEVNESTTIRSASGTSGDVLGWVVKGTHVMVVGQQGNWLNVRMPDGVRQGWIETGVFQISKKQSLNKDKITAKEKPKQAVKRQPIAEEKQLSSAKKTSSPVKDSMKGDLFKFMRKANLRAGPDTKFDVVSWASIGSLAYELSRKGNWMRVQMKLSKRIGWVYKESLSLIKAGATFPVIAKGVGRAREPLAAQSVHMIARKRSDELFVFKQRTNLRAGPGKQYDEVDWGGKHETATVLKQKGDWSRVRMSMSGKVGWVLNTTLISAGTGHAIQAIVKSGDKAKIKMYLVLQTEALRAKPMKFSELSGWVGMGESVALLDQRKGWMRVQPQDAAKKSGWIKVDYLKLTTEIQTAVKPKESLRVVPYQARISKGESFNYSHAALETALYPVPVEDISVRIREDDLEALFRKDIYDKSEFEIRLVAGRHRMSGHIKVLGSSTRIFKKKSLRIKLDNDGARWYGRRYIALRSMASDHSMMREWMAWKLLAALGMKVPEVHFTRISFNHGERTGLYLNIEWMGSSFLKENHLAVNGGFYQPSDSSRCGNLYTIENMNLCFDKITPHDNDYSALAKMARGVSTASAANMDQVLAKYFNVASVINWIAVNALVTNGDTYNKNYWLHYSPNHKKWTVVPWDYNLIFGRVYDSFSVVPFKIFNDNFQYYFPIDVAAGNPLKDKLVRNPKLRARLEVKLKHLLGIQPDPDESESTFGWFSPTVMQARIGNLASVVGKDVYKDTFLTFGEREFTKTYESVMHFVTAHDYYLKAKLVGPYRWQPSPPFDPNASPVVIPMPKVLYGEGTIKAGDQSVHMTDQGWGYFVAQIDLDEPLKKQVQFKVQVEGDAIPKYLPPAQLPRFCIRRSWALSTETQGVSSDGRVMVEYLQENSKRTEVPVSLHEKLLQLWVRDGSHWRPLKTEVNEYANTLIASGVHMESGHVQRFVACSPF